MNPRNNLKLTDYPESIFIGTWGLAFLLNLLVLGSATVEVLLYFVVFSFCLAGGSIFFSKFRRTSRILHLNATFTPMLAIVIFILILTDVFYARQVYVFILNSNSVPSALFNLRQSALNGNSVIKGESIFVGANQLLFGLSSFGYVMLQYGKIKFDINANCKHLINKAPKSNYLCALGVLISMVISTLDGSRSFFLSAMLALLFMLYQLGKVGARQIVIFMLLFLFLFAATFSIFRTDAANDLTEEFKYTAAYFSGGIGSLDHALRGEVTVYWYDLEEMENKLESIGLPFDKNDLQSLKMDYIDVGEGITSNVYTALGVYHEYMGYGSLLFAFFLGGLMRLMKVLSKNSFYGLYCYSFFLTALILSVFHDYFLSFSYFLLKILLSIFFIRMLEQFLGKIWNLRFHWRLNFANRAFCKSLNN